MSRNRRQDAKVERHDDGNKDPEHGEKLALCDQIRLAGLINQFGDFAHRAVHRKVLELKVDRESEQQAEDTEDESNQQ